MLLCSPHSVGNVVWLMKWFNFPGRKWTEVIPKLVSSLQAFLGTDAALKLSDLEGTQDGYAMLIDTKDKDKFQGRSDS